MNTYANIQTIPSLKSPLYVSITNKNKKNYVLNQGLLFEITTNYGEVEENMQIFIKNLKENLTKYQKLKFL